MKKSSHFSRFHLPFASFASFVVSLLFPGFASAAAPADFAAVRDVLGADRRAPRLVEVRLDPAVLAATRPGFPDLRLFDAAGTEVPRAVEVLHTPRPRTVRHAVGAAATELRELPGNRIEARFELRENESAPGGLDIRTPLKDFYRTVRVSGSADGTTWEPLADADIFDYSRYLDIRRTEIPLPENNFRRFSIEIGNASEERAQPLVRLVQADGKDLTRALELLQTPFRIDGVSFWRETTTMEKHEPVLQEWPHGGFEIKQDPKAKTTEILIQARQVPVTRVQVETPARNFQRPASVMAPVLVQGHLSWRAAGKGQLTRVDLPGYSRDEVQFDFPEVRAGQLRLVIRNADNPPLEITGIRLHGPVYRLLWIAEPGAVYRLACGHDRLDTPAYDLFAIRTAQEKGLEPDLWKLAGAPEPPGASGTERFSLGAFVARPVVFGTLLALAALALLGLLARALKKTE